MLKRNCLVLLEMNSREMSRAASLDPQDPRVARYARLASQREGVSPLNRAHKGYEDAVNHFMTKESESYAKFAAEELASGRRGREDGVGASASQMRRTFSGSDTSESGLPRYSNAEFVLGSLRAEFDKMAKSYSYLPDKFFGEVLAIGAEYCGRGDEFEDDDCEQVVDNVASFMRILIESFFYNLRATSEFLGLCKGVLPFSEELFKGDDKVPDPALAKSVSFANKNQHISACADLDKALRILLRKDGVDHRDFFKDVLPPHAPHKVFYRSSSDVKNHARFVFGNRYEEEALKATKAYLLALVRG